VVGKTACATCWQPWLRYDGEKRLVVIHDRGEPQKGAPVEAVEPAAAGRLGLRPPPAYSPALHPEERLWQWMRRVVTHHHGFATLQEELHAIQDFFCYLAGRKEEVRRLCALKIPESLVALL
jgi:hypothetical protein